MERGATEAEGHRRPSARIALLLLVGLPLTITLLGIPYYLLPIAERLRSPLHPWFKSTGPVGQAAGWMAFALFVFLWLYPLRKKYRWLAWTGPITEWLHLHVFAGLAILLLAAIHASWRFAGLIGVGYYAMLVVALSGVVGRYLYVRIPRNKSGLEMSREQLNTQRQALVQKIAAATEFEPQEVERMLLTGHEGKETPGTGQVLLRLISDDLARWKVERALRRRLHTRAGGQPVLDPRELREILKLAHREIALTQQLEMLEATQRVFAYWHVVHRPVSITALVLIAVHVVVSILVGVTWLK